MISGTLESLALALMLVAAAPAVEQQPVDAPDLAGLLARLSTDNSQTMRFEESRPSSLLAEPVIVTGSLQRDGDRLIRETSAPRQETQILSREHFEVRRPGGFRQRFSLSRAPELAALRQALLALLDGDLEQLDQHFDHELRWEDALWALDLRPRDPAMAERVDLLALSGDDDRLLSMTLHLSDGDHIATRFLADQ